MHTLERRPMQTFLARSAYALIFAQAATSLACDDGVPRSGGGSQLTIEVSPLSLSGITEVYYQLSVVADDELVWEEQVSSTRFGDGAGGLTYIGPCDASAERNTVYLDILEIHDENGPIAFVDPTELEPLQRDATCRPNADTLVAFDITVMRPAEQGFFDVAVDFDDIFCSAKVDCVDAEGEENLLLFDPDTGLRVPSAVMATACTAGPGQATELYLDALVLDCGALGAFDVPIDTGAPGNVYTTNPAGPLRQVATYQGTERLTQGGPAVPLAKLYFNVALALDPGAIAAGTTCTLRSRLTAHDGALDECKLGPGRVYPMIEVLVSPFADQTGLVCGRHPLDDPGAPEGTGVFTSYLDQGEHQFHTRIHVGDGDALVVEGCPECALQVPPLAQDPAMDDCLAALSAADDGLLMASTYLDAITERLLMAASDTVDAPTRLALDEQVALLAQELLSVLANTQHGGHTLFSGADHTFTASPFGPSVACFETSRTKLDSLVAPLGTLSAVTLADAQASLATVQAMSATATERRLVLNSLRERARHDMDLGQALRETLGEGVVCDDCDPLAVQLARSTTAIGTGLQPTYNLGSTCIGLCSAARTEAVIGTRSTLERLTSLRTLLLNALDHRAETSWRAAHEEAVALAVAGLDRALEAVDVGGGALLTGANDHTSDCFAGATFDWRGVSLGLDALSVETQADVVQSLAILDQAIDTLEATTIAGGLGDQDALGLPRSPDLQASDTSLRTCSGLLTTAEGALLAVAPLVREARSVCESGTDPLLSPASRVQLANALAGLVRQVDFIRAQSRFSDRPIFGGGDFTWLTLIDRQPTPCISQADLDLTPLTVGLGTLSVANETSAAQCLGALDTLEDGLESQRAEVGARLAVVSRQVQWANELDGQTQAESYRKQGVDFMREATTFQRLTALRDVGAALDLDTSLVPYQTDLHPQVLLMSGAWQLAEADRDLARRLDQLAAMGLDEVDCDPARVRSLSELRWLSSGLHDRLTDDLNCTGPCYLERLRAMTAADSIRGRLESLRAYAASIAIAAPTLRQDIAALVNDHLAAIDQVASTFNPNPLPGCFASNLDLTVASLGLAPLTLDSPAAFEAAVTTLDHALATLEGQLDAAGFFETGHVFAPRASQGDASAAVLDTYGLQLATAEIAHRAIAATTDDIATLCLMASDAQATSRDRASYETRRAALAVEATRVARDTRLLEGPFLTRGGDFAWRYAYGDGFATAFTQGELELLSIAQALEALDTSDQASALSCGQTIEATLRPALATWLTRIQGRSQRLQLEAALARAVAEQARATATRQSWTELDAVAGCHQQTLAALSAGTPLAPCDGLTRPPLDLCDAARPLAQAVIEHAQQVVTAMRALALEAAEPATSDTRRSELALPFGDLRASYDRMLGLASINQAPLLDGPNPTASTCFGQSFDLDTTTLGLSGLDVSTLGDATTAASLLEAALVTLESAHATIGAP